MKIFLLLILNLFTAVKTHLGVGGGTAVNTDVAAYPKVLLNDDTTSPNPVISRRKLREQPSISKCGIIGLNFFCPSPGKCGFWKRLFHINGCQLKDDDDNDEEGKPDVQVACTFLGLSNITQCQETEDGFVRPFDSDRMVNTIPTELGLLTKLTYLGLSNEQLTGTIPSELGQLTRLLQMDLFDNLLTGTIPSTFGQLTQMEVLILFENQLNGTIPSTLGQMTQLLSMEMRKNQLSGIIPSTLGQLTQLGVLKLDENQLKGTIPSTLGQLTLLEVLSLPSNQLTGTIPTTLEQFTLLRFLFLYENQLTGTISSTLCRPCPSCGFVNLLIDCDVVACSCCGSCK